MALIDEIKKLSDDEINAVIPTLSDEEFNLLQSSIQQEQPQQQAPAAQAPQQQAAPDFSVEGVRSQIPESFGQDRISQQLQDVTGQFQAGLAETGLALQPIEEALFGELSPRRPGIEQMSDIPEPKTFLGGLARTAGEFSEPILPGAPPFTGVFAPLGPLAKSTLGKIAIKETAEGSIARFPAISNFIAKGKTVIDPSQFRRLYDFVVKKVGGVSDEAADILYDDPKLLNNISSVISSTEGDRIAYTTSAKKAITGANKKQAAAVKLVANNVDDFIEKTQDKAKLTGMLIDSGVDEGRAAKIVSDPKRYLNTTETAAGMGDKVLKSLQGQKQIANRQFGEALDLVFQDKRVVDAKPVVDDFVAAFNRVTSSEKFQRTRSKGFLVGKEIMEDINRVKPDVFKLELGKDGILISKTVKQDIVNLKAKDMHMLKKIIQDGISEKEITGDVANVLTGFADNLNQTIRVSNPVYGPANDLFASTVSKIESVIGKGKAGKLHDENVYRQFRNKLMAAGQASAEKVDEDIIDVITTINPGLADELDAFMIAKIERKNIAKFVKNSTSKINEGLTLQTLNQNLGDVSNVTKKDAIKMIDDYVPNNMKYFNEARKSLATNEFVRPGASPRESPISLFFRLGAAVVAPEKRAVQAARGSRAITEGLLPFAAKTAKPLLPFVSPGAAAVQADRRVR